MYRPVMYTVTNAKPAGPEYHGPGSTRNSYYLSLYHRTNHETGVHKAAVLGYSWVDLDGRRCLDGWVFAHSDHMQEKEHFFAPGIPSWKKISQMTWAEVSQLRTRQGYRIRRVDQLFGQANRDKIGVAFDIKSAMSDREVDRIISAANRFNIRFYAKCDPTKEHLVFTLNKFQRGNVWTRFNGQKVFRAPVK